MKRFLKYIFIALISCIGLISCVKELELETPVAHNDEVTLVPRVKSFTNQYVTKAEGNNETDIKTLNVLIFNEAGNLVYSKSHTGELSSVTLNKSMLNLTNATIVMIANVDLSTVKYDTSSLSTAVTAKSVTLSDMENYVCHFSDALLTEVPDSGLPMIGGTKVTADQANDSALAISLKILYSKVSFNISVENGSENYGTGMEFTLSGATITNLAGATPLAVPTEEGKPVCDFLGNPVLTETGKETNADADGYTDSGYIVKKTDGNAQSLTITGASGNTKVGATTPLSFTFYIPENRYNHGGLTGIYPDASWTNSTTSSLYDSYKQHYKPALAAKSGGAGMPSYVTLTGTYVDYRGTSWDVNYTVYLGKDNYQNFQVDRNSQYTNYITIKGIRNNDSYTDAGSVWMDHRVDVSTSDLAGNVTITRETLIDAHIEVRPLRVKWSGTTYDGVRVYLPTEKGSLVNWIGIERFTGDNCLDGAAYCYVGGQATGKRKYFTTSLIDELQSMAGEYGVQTSKDNQKYIYLLNGECAWIYFDENTTGSLRPADIKLEFYKSDGTVVTETYRIKQAAIQTVSGYSIESYEEYLHSYDSADKYNLSTTPADYTQQGLAWGWTNTSVSETQIASATALPGLDYYSDAQYVKDIRYDFWHKSDGNFNVYSAGNSWGALSDDAKNNETGLAFTNRATENLGITVIDMGTKPSSAYQYCLSKNKFKEDAFGNHTIDVHWYMPDVHELESVLKANSNAADFKSDAYYWSSQPSYTDKINSDVLDYLAGLFGREVAIVDENVEYARAASSTSTKGADVLRTANNRIRCFYSAEGIKNVDMSERVPDGLDGNFTFWMKAWTNGFNSDNGYFQKLIKDLEADEKTNTIQEYRYPDVSYPLEGAQVVDEKFSYTSFVDVDKVTHWGFTLDPTLQSSWTKYKTILGEETDYYTTLAIYPGLTIKKLEKRTVGDAYKPIDGTTKTSVEIIESYDLYSNNEDLTTTSYNEKLDHTYNDNKLQIVFSVGNGDKNPEYEYKLEDNAIETTNTKTWIPPTYTEDNFTETGGDVTVSDTGYGSNESVYANTTSGLKSAKQLTFRIAYELAQDNARDNLKNQVKNTYGITLSNADIKISPSDLSWDSPEGENLSYTYRTDKPLFITYYYVKCNVTLTASATITVAGSPRTLYVQDADTGKWSEPDPDSTDPQTVLKIDELRMYCGNSFTISVSDPNYEITKIKVYYSGDNKVASGIMGDGIFNQRQTDVYARFVTPNILSDDTIVKEKEIYVVGSAEPLQLPGMDYSEDGSKGWQQWTGDGQSAVTLVLADYAKVNNVISNLYKYQKANTKLSENIIIDRIEVKCTKKTTTASGQ